MRFIAKLIYKYTRQIIIKMNVMTGINHNYYLTGWVCSATRSNAKFLLPWCWYIKPEIEITRNVILFPHEK